MMATGLAAYPDGQYQYLVKTPSAGRKGDARSQSDRLHCLRQRASDLRSLGCVWHTLWYQPGIGASSTSSSSRTPTSASGKTDNGSWTALQDWTASSHINAGTAWNRLKLVRNGTSIVVYANNQLLATVSDSSFTGLRRIGLVAQSPDDSGLDARFDATPSLYPASCGAGATGAANTTGVGFEMGEPGGTAAPMPPGLAQMPELGGRFGRPSPLPCSRAMVRRGDRKSTVYACPLTQDWAGQVV